MSDIEAAEEALQILTEYAKVNTLDLYITAAAGAWGELEPVGEALGARKASLACTLPVMIDHLDLDCQSGRQ